jgi:hypothetical protein
MFLQDSLIDYNTRKILATSFGNCFLLKEYIVASVGRPSDVAPDS